MLLRKLELQGWRCFADPIAVGPFTDGLNIVHGPNGSGKSTLLWALARGLFDKHDVSANSVRNLQPWGKSLNPQVTITFEHEGVEYQALKRFISDTVSELSRKEGGKFVRLAESRKANDQIRKMLSGEAPNRGASKTTDWGFAQVLWSMQGAFRIEAISDGTRNTIAESLGAQIVGVQASEIEEQIKAEYQSVFTPTGKLSTGANAHPIVRHREQLAAALESLSSWREKAIRFEELSRSIQDKSNSLEHHRREATNFEEKIAKMDKALEEWKELTTKQTLLSKDLSHAQERLQQLIEKSKQIDEQAARSRQTKNELAELERETPSLIAASKQAAEALETIAAQIKELRKQKGEITTSLRTAERAAQFVRSSSTGANLSERVAEVDGIDSSLNELRKSRAELKSPTEKQLREIEAAFGAVHDARIQFDAALITLELVAESPVTVEVQSGETTDDPQLKAGDALSAKGVGDAAIRIPGVGVISARGPSESADEYEETLAKAERRLEQLLVGFQDADLAELKRRQQNAESLRQQIDSLERERAALLQKQTLDDARAEAERLQAIVAEIAAEFPDWVDSPPDDAALLAAAQLAEADLSRQLELAISKQEIEQKAKISSDRRLDKHQVLVASKQQQMVVATEQLESLRGEQSDEERQLGIGEASQAKKVSGIKLKEVDDALAEMENPVELIETYRNALKESRRKVDELSVEISKREGMLSTLSDEAPYAKTTELEEEIAELEKQIAGEALQTEAIRLLYNVVEEERSSALGSRVEPIRRRAMQTLKRIAGPRFDGIEFNESFIPQKVLPYQHDGEVALDLLSGGEEEQVHFAVRLALADAAFREQRHLVVLDDAFTATDTERLMRITKILQETAEKFQIVLLSCHPERYSHLPDVTLFDLEKLAHGGE